MTTVGDVIEDLRTTLRGSIEEQSTTLANDIAADALTCTFTDTRSIALGATSGVMEIGRELIFVATIDANGNAVIPPWGRGYKGTAAANHTAGDRVISQPQYPRQRLLDRLNMTLGRMFPAVYAVKSFNTVVTTPVFTYNLPDDAERVLTAEWQVPDGTEGWLTVQHWKVNPPGRPTSASGNNPDKGVTVPVGDRWIMDGQPLHFIYSAQFNQMDDESVDFATAIGSAPESSLADLIVFGAAAALVIPNELSRLQLTSVEQQDRTSKITPSAGLTASRYLEQMFQARLAEERKTLQQLYPPRVTGPWL